MSQKWMKIDVNAAGNESFANLRRLNIRLALETMDLWFEDRMPTSWELCLRCNKLMHDLKWRSVEVFAFKSKVVVFGPVDYLISKKDKSLSSKQEYRVLDV